MELFYSDIYFCQNSENCILIVHAFYHVNCTSIKLIKTSMAIPISSITVDYQNIRALRNHSRSVLELALGVQARILNSVSWESMSM